MVTLLLLALAAPPAAFAGRAVAVNGDVSLTRADARAPLARGDYLLTGDVIATGDGGKVRLLMRDKSVLALGGSSRLKIAAYDVEPAAKRRRARLTVLVGRLWAFVTETVNPDASYEVDTGNAVAGVRGTELVFDVEDTGGSQLTVISGEVDLAAEAGRETVGARERGAIAASGIALSTASEEAIAGIRDAVRPEQDLDAAKAERRLAAARAKSTTEDESQRTADERDVDRDEPGTGSSVFEDAGGEVGDRSAFDGPTGLFDPSTMARVRVRVEVRP